MKFRAYYELCKPRLSFLVVFSSAIGYLLGFSGSLSLNDFILFCVGGFLFSGCSVIVNQILEVPQDTVMNRTAGRPLPSGRVTKIESAIFAVVLLILGSFIILFSTNILTVWVSLISSLLYCFAYTPMKRVGPIAVLIGAIPGALPPLIGWVGATGAIDHHALVLFGIQFIWQFPHFWAIAWVADEDYKKAGFKLLPSNGGKDLKTAFNIMIYTLFLIPCGLLPTYFGLSGINAGIVAVVCGILFLAQTFSLMKDGSRKSALKIMFGSFIYLPIVQIAYLLDKI